tara:strand:+ start:882 stop:1100 length:219 start_codon:yes stop_codon:yes gene_type:complete
MTTHTTLTREARIIAIRKELADPKTTRRKRASLASELGGLGGAGSVGRRVAAKRANQVRWAASKLKSDPKKK